MDTTGKYIRACMKAEEIQRLWVPIIGDLTDKGIVIDVYSNGYLRISYRRNALHHDTTQNHLKEYLVWLPRQDQLQEIAFEHLKQKYPAYEGGKIVKHNYNIFNLLNTLNNFIIGFERAIIRDNNYDILETTSIEQLWLAFVMKKCYNKSWNGEEWLR